jgi:hypothetical protein
MNLVQFGGMQRDEEEVWDLVKLRSLFFSYPLCLSVFSQYKKEMQRNRARDFLCSSHLIKLRASDLDFSRCNFFPLV